jgi:CubicO group peptidase (beta-lactamase class C family)
MTPVSCRRFAVLLMLWGVVAAQAQGVTNQGPENPEELERFIDEVMAQEMPRCHAPGAVFLLVKDGRIFFAKGYGYADLEQRKPVNANTTPFRVYSVSKTVTATAAMQLIEQGKLARDCDINIYLRPNGVPSTFAQPITLSNLLTHTSGLDNRYITDRSARGVMPAALLPLDEYLARSLPPRLVPPGQIIRYSNQNLVLVGYLIEAASGEPFGKYMDEHVLRPLEMEHSSWWDRPDLADNLATGYSFSHGAYRPLRLSGSCNPAGSLIATATDMGHFLVAQLGEGRYREQQILKPETTREMQSARFTFDRRLPGAGYGFWERYLNDERTIEHAGDASGFVSILRLVPARNQGLFISVNCSEGGRLLRAVEKAYFDRYFPYTPAPVPHNEAARSSIPEGFYRRDSTPVSGLEKLLVLAHGGEQVQAISTSHGVTLRFGPVQREYIQEAPLLFRDAAGSEHIGFKQSADGRWLLIFGAYGVLEKLPFYDTFEFQVVWLAACVLLLISFVFVWPLLWWMRGRRKNVEGSPCPRGWALALGACASLVGLTVVIGSALILLGVVETRFMVEGSQMPVVIKILLLLAPIEVAVGCALVGFAALAWRRKFWTVSARVHYSLVTLAALGLAGWFAHWNMLSWWLTH